jgi:predicted Zn-dependent protease
VSASFVKNSSHNVRESLACHELGHAIGLVHRDGNSCMNADSWPVHPDSFDFDTLDALYAGTYGP